MTDASGNFAYFRLNFEQQGKRAKDLLERARAGDSVALGRFRALPPKLAEAQQIIATDLRFRNWAALKRHTLSMAHEFEAMHGATPPLDADLRTLHIRCGSDLKQPLEEAGFTGDFHEHSYPYLIGPVKDGGPGCLEERARFLVESYGESQEPPLRYEAVLAGLGRDEQRLLDSADYDRVVIWSEGDAYDQLVLIRVLGHYARHRRPPVLELVNQADFPGAVRFIGLGQLPPEALRMVWATRTAAHAAQLKLGIDAWLALAHADPRALAAIMRSGTPALPLLAPALHRHLQELPSTFNGLSITQQMALELLDAEEQSLERLFGRMTYTRDPLPGQGDFQMRDRVLAMETVPQPAFTRRQGVDRSGNERRPWTDVLTINALGRALLRGEVDFHGLNPTTRWVGGVEIRTGEPPWRWDAGARACRR
jgi:hypothetical protein